jgi:lipopolysaccharide transport system permease protein
MNSETEKWDLIIRPQRPWLDLRLGELWQARELILLFVWRDFVSVNKQTILGPAWYVVQPILTPLAFTVVFGQIAKLPTDEMPAFLFYMAGSLVWTYFSQCLVKTSDTFVGNAGLFGKVYFPRLSVPISLLVSNLITFGIQLALFLVFLVGFRVSGADVGPNWAVALLPLLLVIMAGLGLGGGITISALTTRYRDLRLMVSFAMQLFMYATPIVYPLSSVSGGLRLLLLANPMTSVVETFRYAFLGAGSFSLWNLSYSLVFMLVMLFLGMLLFNRVEATFMDTV